MADENNNQSNQGPISKGVNFLNSSGEIGKWGKKAMRSKKALAALRGAFGAGGAAGAAAGGGEAAAGTAAAGVGGLAAAAPIAIGLVLGLVVFAMIFGGAAGTVAGGDLTNNPTPSSSTLPGGSPGPTTSGQPVAPGDVAKFINIGVKQNACEYGNNCQSKGQTLTASQQAVVDEMFTTAFSSPQYVKLLTLGGTKPVNVYFFPKTASMGTGVLSGGAGYNSNDIVAWGFWEALGSSPKGSFTYNRIAHWLIHESIHTIQKRNSTFGFSLNNPAALDSACYDNGWIKTYAYRSSGFGRGVSCTYPYSPTDSYRIVEDEAEAAANNVFCGPGASCDFSVYACSSAVNYPSDCVNTYKWIRTNIFGGTDFFGLP